MLEPFTKSFPQEHNGVAIGDRVSWVGDSGFDDGRRFTGTVAEIHVIDWRPERARALGVPVQEVLYKMEDGSLTEHCRRVKVCPDCNGSGWQWPNLGVNCPAGMAVALSSANGPWWIRCEACNKDGAKPMPPMPNRPLCPETTPRPAPPSD